MTFRLPVPGTACKAEGIQPRVERSETLGNSPPEITALKGRRNVRRALGSVPDKRLIKCDAMSPEKGAEFVLERQPPMMLALIADIRSHFDEGRLTH
jgi:hypothetical protein